MDDTPPDELTLLRQYLGGRDVPCPQCDYNLRDLKGATCPECGEQLTLRVQRAQMRQAAPMAGLVLLSSTTGLHGLLLLYWLLLNFWGANRGGASWDKFLFVNLVSAIISGACLAAWLKCWRRILALPFSQRWLLVAGCALLVLSDVIVFTKLIR